MDGEGLFVPKTHAILHMLSFMVLFGSPDNARLGDQEKDHQPYVKRAVRRTRQWETTFEDEVLGVADRIDAMLQIRSDAVPPIATVAITTRNYDRRICVAFAPQLRRTKPEVRITTQKKARTRAGWPGGMAAGW